MSSKIKNPIIDAARGIAIILVVYGHVIEHSMAPYAQDFFQNPVFKIIYAFHMPLFVFISGYLMAFSLNRNSVRDVFISRCKSLFIPFVSLGILGTLMAYVLNIVFSNNTGRFDILGDLADQLFFKPSVWFLFTLFVLSGLLLLSVELERRVGGIIFAVLYVLLMIIPYNNYCALFYIKWFYLFYLAGYFLNRYCHPEAKPKDLKMSLDSSAFGLRMTVIFFVSLLLFAWLLTNWTKNDYIYINKMNFASAQYFYEILRVLYRYLMGFLGITIVFFIVKQFLKTRMATYLGKIGAYSLDIYIIQMFILEGVYPRMIYRAHIHLDFNAPGILYIVTPLIAIFFVGVCIIISKLLIRKNGLLNKLMLGGRG